LILAGIEKKLFWNIKKQGRIIGSAVDGYQIRSNYQWEKEKISHSFNGGWVFRQSIHIHG